MRLQADLWTAQTYLAQLHQTFTHCSPLTRTRSLCRAAGWQLACVRLTGRRQSALTGDRDELQRRVAPCCLLFFFCWCCRRVSPPSAYLNAAAARSAAPCRPGERQRPTLRRSPPTQPRKKPGWRVNEPPAPCEVRPPEREQLYDTWNVTQVIITGDKINISAVIIATIKLSKLDFYGNQPVKLELFKIQDSKNLYWS